MLGIQKEINVSQVALTADFSLKSMSYIRWCVSIINTKILQICTDTSNNNIYTIS